MKTPLNRKAPASNEMVRSKLQHLFSRYHILLLTVFISFLSVSCEEDQNIIPVTSDNSIQIRGFEVFHIHQTNVRSRVIINPGKDYQIIESGVCWSEFRNPTINDNITMNGSGTGTFITIITGLSANTTYYSKGYVLSNRGTVYTDEKSFTTTCKDIEDPEDCKGTFTDSRDGNEYGWVKIGSQVWMSENLAYLPEVSPPQYGSDHIPFYYVFEYYGTSADNAKKTEQYNKYGVYYNWYAVMHGACPSGWHVPDYNEFSELQNFLIKDGHYSSQGAALKTTTGWGVDDNGDDDYGYGALPTGGRSADRGGIFGSLGVNGHWWTSSEETLWNAWYIDISDDNLSFMSDIGGHEINKVFGFAVRCIRD